jgi:hypothetical protein
MRSPYRCQPVSSFATPSLVAAPPYFGPVVPLLSNEEAPCLIRRERREKKAKKDKNQSRDVHGSREHGANTGVHFSNLNGLRFVAFLLSSSVISLVLLCTFVRRKEALTAVAAFSCCRCRGEARLPTRSMQLLPLHVATGPAMKTRSWWRMSSCIFAALVTLLQPCGGVPAQKSKCNR